MTKTAEIVERLRNQAPAMEAADHMESLEARLEMAREALKRELPIDVKPVDGCSCQGCERARYARHTLAALGDRRTGE